jgi:hypothetical protein
MLLVATKKSELFGVMVIEIVIEPSDVGRYLQVAVCGVAPDLVSTVLIAVHPEIALLLARNVTLDGVFTRAAIGLFCRKVTLMGGTKSALISGLITLAVGAVAARVTVSV